MSVTSDRDESISSRTATPIIYNLPPFTGIGTAQSHRRRSKRWRFPLPGSRRDNAATDMPPTSQQELSTLETASTAEEQRRKDMTAVVAEQQTPENRSTTASKSQVNNNTTTFGTELIETSGPDHQHHPEEEEEPASDDIYVDVLECSPCHPIPTADRTSDTMGKPPTPSQPMRQTSGTRGALTKTPNSGTRKTRNKSQSNTSTNTRQTNPHIVWKSTQK